MWVKPERNSSGRQISMKLLPWQRSSKQLAHLEESLQIDSGAASHGLQHEHQILRYDIASGARCERAAAQPRERAVEAVDPQLQPSHHIGKPQASRVVQVKSGKALTTDRRRHTPDERFDLLRVGIADRVG